MDSSTGNGLKSSPGLRFSDQGTSPAAAVPIDFPDLDPLHLAEWRASAVDDLVTRANVRSFAPREYSNYQYFGDNGEDDPAVFLFGENVPRRNDGRVTDKGLRQLNTFESGCWALFPVDPITGAQGELYQFKPNAPRLTVKYGADGKPKLDQDGNPRQTLVKYETVGAARPFFLAIPDPIAARIAARYGIGEGWEEARADGLHPWEWIAARRREAPLWIVEGAKKAGALLSQGIAAVGLPGIWNWPVPKSDPKEIKPEIARFLAPGRDLVIAFDQDEKSETLGNVASSIGALGEAAKGLGVTVKVAVWASSLGKGLDDVIAAHPENWEALIQILPLDAGLAYFETQRLRASGKEWAEKCRENWRRSKDFTPQITLNQKYLDYQDFKDGGIYCIRSGLGSGKSTNYRRWIEANRETLRFNRVLVLGYRNNLLRQECEKIKGLVHIGEFGEGEIIGDKSLWAALCLDSVWKFRPDDFDGAVIILDEIVSVLKHLFSSQTQIALQREKIILLFIEAIQRARLVICLDGNLPDWVVELMRAIAPKKNVIPILNAYPTPRPVLRWVEGSYRPDKTGKLRLSENCYQGLLDDIARKHSGCVAVSSDSQVLLETGDSLLTGMGYNVLRIDSKTSGDAKVRDFMKNPDQWLAANPTNYVLYSPSAESGLDIAIEGYFVAHYQFCFGPLDIDSSLQQLARIRDVNCPKFLWARKWAVKGDGEDSRWLADSLQKTYHDRLVHDLNRVLVGEADFARIVSEILQTYNRCPAPIQAAAFYVMAQRHFERAHYRDCLKERLEKTGYQILQAIPTLKELGEAFKPEKEKVQREAARKIRDVAPLPKDAFPQNESEQYGQQKAILLDQLPDIDQDEIWGEDFIFEILFKNRNSKHQARCSWLLENLGACQRKEKEKFQKIHDRFFDAEGMGLLWLYQNDSGKVWALWEAGLLKILNHPDPEKIWAPEDPEIAALLKAAQTRPAISLHLGKPGKSAPMQFVGKLLGMVGARWAGKQAKNQGVKTREYRLDKSAQDSPEWAAMIAAIDRKFVKFTSTSLSPVLFKSPSTYQGETPPVLGSQYSDPQSQAGQALEPVPPASQNSIESWRVPVVPICTPRPAPIFPATGAGDHAYMESDFHVGDKVIFHSFLGERLESEIVGVNDYGAWILKNGIKAHPERLEKLAG